MAASTRGVEPWWKWVVLVAIYLECVIIATTSYTSGVMYIAMLDRYHGDEAKTSLVVSIGNSFLALLAPIGSLVTNRFSSRVAIVSGSLCLVLSGILSAFATSLDMLLITYGIIGGIGYALAMPVSAVVLGFYFDKYRNLVITLSVAMVSIGMFAASPLTYLLLDTFALGGTFMIFASIHAQVCVVGIICKPSPMERKIQEKHLLSASKHSLKADKYSCSDMWPSLLKTFRRSCDISLLNSAQFVFYQLSNVMWAVSMFICVVHLPEYASINGAMEGDITLLMTSFSISHACGRFLAALTVAKGSLKDKTLFNQMCVQGVIGIVSVLFPTYSHLDMAKYLISIVTGFGSGVAITVVTPITISIVGLERLSTAHGYSLFCVGLGSLIGPTVAALLYGNTRSYTSSFIFGGCASLLGCGLSLTVLVLQRKGPVPHGAEVLQKEVFVDTDETIKDKTESLINGTDKDETVTLINGTDKDDTVSLINGIGKNETVTLINGTDKDETVTWINGTYKDKPGN